MPSDESAFDAAPPKTRSDGSDESVLPPADAAPTEGLSDPAPELSLDELVDRLPQSPGVYLMKDKKDRVVYVGKAKDLRARVRSYFAESSGDGRAFVRLLRRILSDIETMVTGNEKEALLLENILIKRHKPRFNVKLVDDKNYLVLRLDLKARYPRLEVTRKMREDGARYFGPYHSAGACRQTLKVVNRHFQLRTCTDHVLNNRARPCLQYQIKRCEAPCVFPVPQARYAEQVRDVSLFLDGKSDEVTTRLRDRMMEAAQAEAFEVAATLRDQIAALERTLEEQRVVSAKFLDQDVFGYFRQGDVLELAVLHVRRGKLFGRKNFRFTEQEFPDHESLSAFVGLYYDAGNAIPDEVLLPIAIEDEEAKTEWLGERASEAGKRGRVVLLAPKRGPRHELVELANKNAAINYSTRRNKQRDTADALEKLQRRLGLKRLPRRIECYDISHLQGTDTVASRVVFIDGEPAKHEYRTFKIRSVTNNDYSAMYEVLSRRFRRALQESPPPETPEDSAPIQRGYSTAATAARRSAALLSAREARPAYGTMPTNEDGAADTVIIEDRTEAAEGVERGGWELPDLLVVDGGKGQLQTALAAAKDVGIDWTTALDIISLAKERTDSEGEDQPDRVFLPRTKEPLKLRPNTTEMFVLSRIRDEAHRVAVGFHGAQRKKRTLRSQLDEVRGLGPKRRAALLKGLGSVRAIQAATIDELAAVPGMTRRAAEAVAAYFGSAGASATQTTSAVPADADAASPVPKPPIETPAPLPDLEDAASAELSALDAHDGDEETDEGVLSTLLAQASVRELGG